VIGPATAGGGATTLILNGDFETGDFAGWTRLDGGAGTFVINDGTVAPFSGDAPQTPCGGGFSAMLNQPGSGAHDLFQDFTIPRRTTVAVLHWTDMIRNHATDFSDPNQEFRVEIRDPSTREVLATLFSTDPGDEHLQTCTPRQADISAFIGQPIQLAFVGPDGIHRHCLPALLRLPGRRTR
jgi:hypothetical protein